MMSAPSPSVVDIQAVAASARSLGEKLGGPDQQALEIIAELLDNTFKLVSSLPDVIERAKDTARLEAWRGSASVLRDMASDIESGRKGPLRPQSALRQAASAIEMAVKKQSGSMNRNLQ